MNKGKKEVKMKSKILVLLSVMFISNQSWSACSIATPSDCKSKDECEAASLTSDGKKLLWTTDKDSKDVCIQELPNVANTDCTEILSGGKGPKPDTSSTKQDSQGTSKE